MQFASIINPPITQHRPLAQPVRKCVGKGSVEYDDLARWGSFFESRTNVQLARSCIKTARSQRKVVISTLHSVFQRLSRKRGKAHRSFSLWRSRGRINGRRGLRMSKQCLRTSQILNCRVPLIDEPFTAPSSNVMKLSLVFPLHPPPTTGSATQPPTMSTRTTQ